MTHRQVGGKNRRATKGPHSSWAVGGRPRRPAPHRRTSTSQPPAPRATDGERQFARGDLETVRSRPVHVPPRAPAGYPNRDRRVEAVRGGPAAAHRGRCRSARGSLCEALARSASSPSTSSARAGVADTSSVGAGAAAPIPPNQRPDAPRRSRTPKWSRPDASTNMRSSSIVTGPPTPASLEYRSSAAPSIPTRPSRPSCRQSPAVGPSRCR